MVLVVTDFGCSVFMCNAKRFSHFDNDEVEIVGAQIIGYMFSEVFARVDSSPKEREQLLLANADEIATQAE